MYYCTFPKHILNIYITYNDDVNIFHNAFSKKKKNYVKTKQLKPEYLNSLSEIF